MIKTGVLSRGQSISLQNLGLDYDFWKDPHVGGFALIMSPPEHKRRLFFELRNSKIEFEIVVQNVEE